MPESDNKASSCTVCLLFVMALLAVAATVTLTVLLYIWGQMGFIGTSSLSITNCSQPYFALKYSGMTLLNQTIFGATAGAAFAGLIVFFICLRLLLQNCSKDQKRSNVVTKCNKITLYLFVCFQIMGSSVQAGYYLSFLFEGTKCTLAADSTQMIVLVVLGGAALLCELFVFLITVCSLEMLQDNQQKYRWVDTKQTEPNEVYHRKKQLKPYMTQERQDYQPRMRDQEYTKQLIFDSPSKRPFERIQEKNAVYVNKTYNSNPNDLAMRFIPRQKQENPVLYLHPRLARDGVDQILNANYDNAPHKNFQEDDERYLKEARKNYMDGHNSRKPMPRAEQPAYERYDGTVDRRRYRNDDSLRPPPGRDERDPYEDRNRSPNQYFRDIQPPRRRIQSPVRMIRQEDGYFGGRNY